MAKQKTAFVCSDCGGEHPKWQGQCDHCGVWNTLAEIRLGSAVKTTPVSRSGYAGTTGSQLQTLDSIELESHPRIDSGVAELNRVLGGGFVPGSAIVIGGHPGAGKSTLLLQVLCQLPPELNAVYITGEESLQQVALRAKRLGLATNRLHLLTETNVETICATVEPIKPKILVIDSIQVMHLAEVSSAPGAVGQVRESAAYLTRYAKHSGSVLLIVGHVTKDGSLAGPKVLEHLIDCSLMLESSNDNRYRTLRSSKNRFGAVNELGVFAMTDKGLREVSNPSAIFLTRGDAASSGSVVMVVWEGSRPLLVEIQALVDENRHGHPRRLAVGVDQNRLVLLLAVLHRHGAVAAGDQDVFVNVVGGVKIVETSVDLAVLLAVVSSLRNRPLAQDLVVFGEVGLSGEIRPVPSGQERLREAAKHGFKKAIVPAANKPKTQIESMQVMAVTKLSEALALV